MKNITKRDVKVFLLGMLAMFLISVAYDWDENVKAFNDGFNVRPMKTN
jgi:hypothetical protein